MPLLDLTLPIETVEDQVRSMHEEKRRVPIVEPCRLPLRETPTPSAAMIYFFRNWSMSGTYIDFPGHLVETADGEDAATWPPALLYRVPAGLVRLDVPDGHGPVTAAELAAGCLVPPRPGGALVVNALGRRRFDEIGMRSVWLRRDAVRWIVDSGIRLLAADIYESNTDPQNVFGDLFAARIATVCLPVNLHELPSAPFFLTALPVRFRTVTQVPCRVLAEW